MVQKLSEDFFKLKKNISQDYDGVALTELKNQYRLLLYLKNTCDDIRQRKLKRTVVQTTPARPSCSKPF